MIGKIEHLADWLRDVHALEEQIETLLKGQAERADQYPDLKLRLQTHLDTTQKYKVTINNGIQRLGEDTSIIKRHGSKSYGYRGW